MLKAHLAAAEAHLLSRSGIAANAGHTLHRGTPREVFVREFLSSHLSSRLAIGTGEIIGANSAPREARNQFDIVLYDAGYPKIDLGGGISAFLAESVVATIEVKSLLTEAELSTTIQNAARAKRIERNFGGGVSFGGYRPSGILSISVSYAGPANIETVRNWMTRIEDQQNLNQTRLPPSHALRMAGTSESLDLVCCLGLGTIAFDTLPLSVASDDMRARLPDAKRQVFASSDQNLLWLFLTLVTAASSIQSRGPEFGAYLRDVSFSGRFDP